MAGIKEVANLAGVSVSTVSNVLNGRTEKMSPATLEKVQSAIKELNYRPNKYAQQLKSGIVKMVGVLIPSIMNPNFAVLVNALEHIAKKKYGYQIILGNTNRQAEEEKWYLEDMLASGIKGAIIVSAKTNSPHFAESQRKGMSLISYDEEKSGTDELIMDSVSLDNFRTGYLATEFLLRQGLTDIVFATIEGDISSRITKVKGFNFALNQAVIDPQQRVFCCRGINYYGDSELVETATRTADLILSQRDPLPQAIVAINDMMALGIISHLQKNGIRVPEDISVIGIDNIFLSALSSPALTTISSPVEEMAEALLERLLLRMQGKINSGPQEFLFEPKLVCRESVRLRHSFA